MHNHKAYNEKEILELLATGDAHAFTVIFDLYRARVFTVALRFLRSRELSLEIVQEVFLKIWRRREELVHLGNFEGYLFTMVRNQVFDGLKRLAEEATAKQEFARNIQNTSAADHMLIEEQYAKLLENAVNLLPPKQKQIFRLAKVEGLSHEAIAQQLQISRLTVKTHMARALQHIRQNIQHYLSAVALLPLCFENTCPLV